MTFRFNITDEEFAEYTQNFYKKQFKFGRKSWIYLLILIAIIGINVYNAYQRQANAGTEFSRTPIINWILLIAIFGVSWFLIMRSMTKINQKNADSKSKTWLFVLIPIVFIGLYVYVSGGSSADNQENTQSFLQQFISWLVFVSIFASLWYFIMRRLKVGQLKPEDRETVLGERDMVFDDDRIESKNATASSSYRWEGIKKWEQTTNLYLLYITHNSAFILPKRVFENAAQQTEFEQLLKRKLPNLTSDKYLDA
jgi:uncharacterized membrane protein YhaH (DUF805 family)